MGRERLALYALTSPAAVRAVEVGLADAQWYHPSVPRARLKQLMRRSDAPGLRDTAIWLGLMAFGATTGSVLWSLGHPWLAAPFFLLHGVMYGSAADSRWHETGHGTAFATRDHNERVYAFSSFLMMRDPTVWRWTHTRHHTDTLILGRDPEINAMRPARLARILANLLGLYDVPKALWGMVFHASGRLTTDELEVIPSSERGAVRRTARWWLGVYAGTVALAVATSSWIPLLVIGGPRMYGATMQVIYGLTQHAGLGENVLDHRLNTRSVRMNRINRFIYSNMNYHVEHHLFPMVPYHRLPELHAEIAHDLAPMYPSIMATLREIVPTVLRQLRDQTHYVRRELPPGATPYYEPAITLTDV